MMSLKIDSVKKIYQYLIFDVYDDTEVVSLGETYSFEVALDRAKCFKRRFNSLHRVFIYPVEIVDVHNLDNVAFEVK